MQIITECLPVPAGKVASVVTFLEMTVAPPPARVDAGPYRFERVSRCDLDWYRRFFQRIGADWLWYSRLLMTDAELRGTLDHPEVDFYLLRDQGEEMGFFELDRRNQPDIEIRFFGLAPELVGKGLGKAMMAKALEVAWSYRPRRLFLHTCTLDHPRAVEFYRKAGFVAYGREVEIHDDPRVLGVLPRTVAPYVPIVE
ncbi:MAG: GNAT family N-acetyltransferase [Bryobacteraceae bacterium]